MDMVELVKQFGFPIAVAIYMIIDKGRTEREHKQDLRNMATKVVTALDTSTEAIKDATEKGVRNTAALEAATVVLNEVKGVLTARGGGNGNT